MYNNGNIGMDNQRRDVSSLHTFAVCAYGESPYLEECIQSLKNQTVKSTILIATSTPNSYIQGVAEKFSIPVFINRGKSGITEDWNFAYTHSSTDYVTITHQDDIYDPEYAECAVKRLEKANKPLIFFTGYYEIRNGNKVYSNKLLNIKKTMLLPLRMPFTAGSRWVRRRILSFGSPICCPSVTFARKNLPYVVFKHGFRACEDWEAWEMISKIRGQFLYDPKVIVGHRIHEGSETSAIIGDNGRSAEEYEMYCKFWPKGIAGLLNSQYAKAQESNTTKK